LEIVETQAFSGKSAATPWLLLLPANPRPGRPAFRSTAALDGLTKADKIEKGYFQGFQAAEKTTFAWVALEIGE
jgi:hypothetical protein